MVQDPDQGIYSLIFIIFWNLPIHQIPNIYGLNVFQTPKARKYGISA